MIQSGIARGHCKKMMQFFDRLSVNGDAIILILLFSEQLHYPMKSTLHVSALALGKRILNTIIRRSI